MKHLITICLLVMSLTSTAQTYSKELLKSAKRGDAVAQRDLGLCYLNGSGIKADGEKAFIYLLSAAMQDNSDAAFQLALMYENKNSTQYTFLSKANKVRRLFEKAEAIQNGFAYPLKSYYRSIVFRDFANNYWPSVAMQELYKKAANSGICEAQMKLAYIYQNTNKATAISWFMKAAEQGNSEAQYQLGWYFYKGEGVNKNLYEARMWLTKAVSQNNPNAQNLLNEIGSEIRRDSLEQVRRQEAERLRLEEERRTQSLLAKGTMLLPYNRLEEVKDYHFFGSFVDYDIARSQARLLGALCKNDVLSYAGMQNADNLDRAAYLQSNQYQLDKQQLGNRREDIFAYMYLLSNMKLISATNPIYEADGFKLRLYPEEIKDFKGNYLYINGFVIPTKSCTVGGFHYFKSNNIAALQKIKQSERNVNAVFVLLCKPGFNVDNTDINVVRPTALYITDRSTNEILMDLSQYLRTIDTQAEKQQIISQVKNDLSKVKQYKKKHNPDIKYERKYHREPFRYQCGFCGGQGYVEQFKGGVLTKVRCTTCYGHGYLETHYY